MRNKKFFFITLTDFAYLCVLISKETITITYIMKEYNDTNLDDDVEEYYTHLQPDTLLQKGKYRIIRFIKSGGFGCTYEAVNTTWQDRRVAIKEFYIDDFCHRRQQDGRVTVTTPNKKPHFEKFRKKFWDEANRINQLTHSGVVRVTDFFEENGTVYYVMDYIEGNSLHDLIAKNGALSEAKALYYIRQVADALQYVHEAGLMHLDIKPGNIMVSDKDKAILIDFGVSRQYDEVSNAHTSTLVPYTEGFAPIEQMGRNVREFGAATDIYALGATLYALLTGESPLSATILASGEKLPALPSKISATTRRAVLSAMSINKDNRPQSVAEFLALLDGKKTGGGRSGGSQPPKSDKPFPWPLVALAGIILSVAAVVGLRGCESHSGREAGIPDTTAVAIDSAAVSSETPSKQASGAKPTTEKLIQDALEKQSEKEDRLARLEAENQQMKEKIRQDSLAAVKKAEEERKEKERLVQAAREAEAARKAEEAKKATAQQVVATRPSNGYINGHEYVDLGLSVKWATCNVGASSASDYGSYYAWGETTTKTDYSSGNSTTYGKSIGDISGDSRYDAARRNWGGSWRMPTKAECQELVDNCTWTWTTQGGHNGYRVTGKNGNSIFLPAAGCRCGSSLDYQGEFGLCWSSTPGESYTEYAYSLFFDSSYHPVYWGYRYGGRAVRPVSE